MGANRADEVLLGFARALRASGVPVTHDRARCFLTAAAAVGADDQRATYVAGRTTLCASPDDLARYDQVFTAYFDPGSNLPRREPAVREAKTPQTLPAEDGRGAGEDDGSDPVAAKASAAEVLRHRDVASLSNAEKHQLAAMFTRLRPRPPMRATARQQRWHRGGLDGSRTLRASLRRMGEPGELHWRRPARRPRKVVFLIDVSGSMSGYADALLRLAHRVGQAGVPVETFTLGTRLTHVTRALRGRDPERALATAGETVPDWSGGTRLGETLKVFVDRWGRRGVARGAVVVVFSDGWERGEAALLGDQAARLRRIAHRLVWVNPHRGKDGYQPVQQGVVAVLPHVDAFIAGHSLATFAEVLEVVADA